MATRPADHKAVVDTLVDEELDLRKLVDQINVVGPSLGAKVTAMVERMMGKHAGMSKQLLRQAWNVVFLNAYAKFAKAAERHTDQNLKQQVAAIKKFGKPITQIEAVVDEDVKQRVSEKAIG